jgi:bifunctional non-homologous end joining protein LigD
MSPARKPLAEYERKRSFASTPEPDGEASASGDPGSRFVVHEHHARRLHWDLRLEHDGVLASWAIPNGIPTDPSHNRKAVHVEDHPLDYLDFHGTIPEGNYGAGEIGIWDSGTFTTEKWRTDEVIVVFDGERLSGRYALFKAGREEKDWMIHRMDPPVDKQAEEIPEFIEPMLAKLTGLPPDEDDWAFEIKWDGVRAICRSEPGRLALLSRNANDITGAYPELRALNRALGSHSAVLDGEIVAFDEAGRPSFQALQGRMHLRGEGAVRRLAASSPVTYIIFDLLWLDGHPLLGLPYTERRAALAGLALTGDRWQVPAYHAGDGGDLLAATRRMGLEGVVAKRLASKYTPGKRNWVKLKNQQRQEVVIGGWTAGTGSRAQRLGALQVGVYHDDGELHYVGGVGTGFNEAELDRLGTRLAGLKQDSSPFTGRQPPKAAHFVTPELVCEVEFSEWTRTGTLRHPSYQGLRDDKPAAEVVRERPGEVPEASDGSQASGAAASPGGSVGSTGIRALVEGGREVRGGVEIELDGRTLKLTNLDKVLYPEAGFTKLDLIRYYADVAPTALVHLTGRPLTLKRYPNGVEGDFFYEKNSPAHRPDWVRTAELPKDRGKGTIAYTLCEDVPTLVWLANLADIELHPSLSMASEVTRPTTLAFDLDPGAPATIVECATVALELQDLFGQLGLEAYAKTSGSKGMQIYVPLNHDETSYEQTKPFSRAVAQLLEKRHSDLVVSQQAKVKRTGKVLIDWSQNDEHKTTVAVYSMRATALPRVSTPLTWAEVKRCADSGDPDMLSFGPEDVLKRIAADGDRFAEVASRRQTLPDFGTGS